MLRYWFVSYLFNSNFNYIFLWCWIQWRCVNSSSLLNILNEVYSAWPSTSSNGLSGVLVQVLMHISACANTLTMNLSVLEDQKKGVIQSPTCEEEALRPLSVLHLEQHRWALSTLFLTSVTDANRKSKSWFPPKQKKKSGSTIKCRKCRLFTTFLSFSIKITYRCGIKTIATLPVRRHLSNKNKITLNK